MRAGAAEPQSRSSSARGTLLTAARPPTNHKLAKVVAKTRTRLGPDCIFGQRTNMANKAAYAICTAARRRRERSKPEPFMVD